MKAKSRVNRVVLFNAIFLFFVLAAARLSFTSESLDQFEAETTEKTSGTDTRRVNIDPLGPKLHISVDESTLIISVSNPGTESCFYFDSLQSKRLLPGDFKVRLRDSKGMVFVKKEKSRSIWKAGTMPNHLMQEVPDLKELPPGESREKRIEFDAMVNSLYPEYRNRAVDIDVHFCIWTNKEFTKRVETNSGWIKLERP